MRRVLAAVGIACAGLAAVLASGSVAGDRRQAEVVTIQIPGPVVTAATQLRVGRRYKLLLRGTGASRQGKDPDFDWMYCFAATCGSPNRRVALGYFCGSEPSNFPNGHTIPYRPDHTYELTVERTFDSPGPGGVTNRGQLLFRDAAGDVLGSCQRGENEPGTFAFDPFLATAALLTYIENGTTKRGPGGTFTMELTDVGAISRPPTSTTPSTGPSPANPSGGSAPATSLNTAVVGKHYAVGASTTRKAVTGGGTFTTSAGTYKVVGLQARLSSGFTYTASRTGRGVTGTATVTIFLVKQAGSGPPTASVPLSYKVAAAAKSTPDKAAREWAFTASLVKPSVRGCETARVAVGKLARSYVSVAACGLSAFFRPATVSIA